MLLIGDFPLLTSPDKCETRPGVEDPRHTLNRRKLCFYARIRASTDIRRTGNEEVGQTWTHDWNPISPNQSHVFNGYVGELRHFIDCVRAGRPPVPSIQDELKTMAYLAEIAAKADIPLEWAFISSAL